MSVKVRCPNAACGKLLAVPEAHRGKMLVCPGCRQQFRAPAPPPADAEEPIDTEEAPPARAPKKAERPTRDDDRYDDRDDDREETPARPVKRRLPLAALVAAVVVGGIAAAVGSMVASRLVGGLTGGGSAEWRPHTSAAGRYTVVGPGTPVNRTETANTLAGPLTVHFDTFKGPGRQEYAASYADYPEGIVQGRDPAALLDGVRDGAVKGMKGRLLKETPLTIDGHPGREFEVEIAQPLRALAVQRVYLVGNRLYQLMAISPFERASAVDREKFFGSFRVTPAGPGT